MTTDYYDPHPRLSIDCPLVLVGHPGSGVQTVGRMVAGRTGLPFSDVERMVEGRRGCSRARILVEQGLETLRHLECDALTQALRRQPHGIIAIGSGPFEDAGILKATREAAHLLWVRRPAEVLLQRIRRAIDRAPASVPEFVVAVPSRATELALHLSPSEEALRESHTILQAEDQHSARVAEDVLGSLDRLVGAVAL